MSASRPKQSMPCSSQQKNQIVSICPNLCLSQFREVLTSKTYYGSSPEIHLFDSGSIENDNLLIGSHANRWAASLTLPLSDYRPPSTLQKDHTSTQFIVDGYARDSELDMALAYSCGPKYILLLFEQNPNMSPTDVSITKTSLLPTRPSLFFSRTRKQKKNTVRNLPKIEHISGVRESNHRIR